MDNNKISDNCKQCMHRKQTIFEKLSKLDGYDIGTFFMKISAIIAGIVLFIIAQPVFGLLATILISCVVIFIIGFFMHIC